MISSSFLEKGVKIPYIDLTAPWIHDIFENLQCVSY